MTVDRSRRSEWFTAEAPGGLRRIAVLDSATFTHRYVSSEPDYLGGEVVVSASYAGVYCAKLTLEAKPFAAIGLDCGIGKDGAGIAGLWYLEALGIPAAAASVESVELGNGLDLWENGTISRANGIAEAVGLAPGTPVQAAAELLATASTELPEPDGENREIVYESPDGHCIVLTNSIAHVLPEDEGRNVLCTAGHTGRSVVDYIIGFRPYAFICSDGGIGKNRSGLTALEPANDAGIPGASVSAQSARMGDGHSTYYDGIVSACNALASEAGVKVGMSAVEAAHLLADREAAQMAESASL